MATDSVAESRKPKLGLNGAVEQEHKNGVEPQDKCRTKLDKRKADTKGERPLSPFTLVDSLGNSIDMASQHSTEPQNKNKGSVTQSTQTKRDESPQIEQEENEAITKQLADAQCELVAKNIENEAFRKLQFQLKEMIKKLRRDNEALLHEIKVMKSEFVKLQDQLAIVKTEAEVYKEDFESERKDREKAHDLKEEMRLACDEKVLAMEKTIQQLTKRLEEGGDTQQDELAMKLVKSDCEVKQLQDQLFEARQKAITAQEEVQAKTVQVTQYRKRLDQEVGKLTQLETRNKELVHQMEKAKEKIEKTRTAKAVEKAETKSSQGEIERLCRELEKASKKIDYQKMSKSEAHRELLKIQHENESVRAENETINESLKKVQDHFERLKAKHLKLKKELTMSTPTQVLKLEGKNQELLGKNQELAQKMQMMKDKLSSENDSLKRTVLKLQEKLATADNLDQPLTLPNYLESSSYPKQNGLQQQWDNGSSQWAQQAQYGQPEPHPLYQQGTVQPKPHYNHPPSPAQYGHHPQQQFEQPQDHYNARPNPNPQWRMSEPPSPFYIRNVFESSDELFSQQDEKYDYQLSSSFPDPIVLPQQSPIPRRRLDSYTLGENFPLNEKPKPKPRKRPLSLNRETDAPLVAVQSNPSNKDTSNPPKGLATECHEMAANLLFQQNESDKVQTNELAPFDPNLVCPMCRKKHRIGEIQKFRAHVKDCPSAKVTTELGTDTRPFTIQQ